MFRFTIRELLVLMASFAFAIAWWLEHRARIDAAEDARSLAHYSAYGSHCSQEALWRLHLEEKYGAKRITWRDASDELKLVLPKVGEQKTVDTKLLP